MDSDGLIAGFKRRDAAEIGPEIPDSERLDQIEKSLRKTYRQEIMTPFVKAITEYQLLAPGDHVAVCISGGKDSMLMAKCFQELKRRNKIPFELTFLCMDPGYLPETLEMIRQNAGILGIPLTLFHSDIFEAVSVIDKSPCYLCARMRRGHLYSKAKELGCNKIALGHHYDDVIETTLLSILYSGQTQTMMPKLRSDNFEGMELIRPMYLIREEAIKRFRDAHGLQFIRCACKMTQATAAEDAARAGGGHSRITGDSLSKRLEVKRLIAALKETNPDVEANIFRSMGNIHLGAVLGYKDKEKVYHSFTDDY